MPVPGREQGAPGGQVEVGRALRCRADRIGIFVFHGYLGGNRTGSQRLGRHPLRGLLQSFHFDRRQHTQRTTDLLERRVRAGDRRAVQHKRAEIAEQGAQFRRWRDLPE